MSRVSRSQHPGAGIIGGLGLAVVDRRRRQQPDPGVPVVGVVPAEERLAEGSGLFDRGEAVREAGPVL